MKRQILILFSFLPVTLLIFSSCQKELGSPAELEIVGTPLPGQTTYCRIESIWHYSGWSDQTFQLVLYDDFENPVAITSPRSDALYPYHVFKYDNWHRLREYRGLGYNGGSTFTHLYGYDQNGRIKVDTTYLYGSPELHYYRTIETFEYDSQNRIVKVDRQSTLDNPTSSVINYEYDSRGNLIFPGLQIPYDNNPSIYRTNDIWMFLARDYSVNNRFPANEYNSAGFGTKFTIQSGPYAFLGSNAIHMVNAQISYSCRPSYW